jgi:hypothetical protein
MPVNPSFSEEAVSEVLEAARRAHDAIQDVATQNTVSPPSELSLRAECISVTVEGGKVCLHLSLGIGRVCIPLPVRIPDGTVAQACLDICTHWGIPTGLCVTVSIEGHQVAKQCFGYC